MENSEENNRVQENISKEEFAALSSNHVKVWPSWIRKYRDIVELILIIIGVTIGVFTLLAIRKQVETAVIQTEAVWHSTRPIIVMKSIEPDKDIIPFTGQVKTPDSTFSNSTLFHTLHIEFENSGQSPGTLDTVYYELFGKGQLHSSFSNLSIIVYPNQKIVEKVPAKLRTDAVNYLRFHYRYYWEQRKVSAQPLYFQREYALEFRDSAWSVGLFPSDSFDSLLASVNLNDSI